MKPYGQFYIFAALVALAGCGGAETAVQQQFDFSTSDGLLRDVQIPAGATLGALPSDVQDAIAAFDQLNVADVVTQAAPGGAPTFTGTAAIVISPQADEEGGALLSGDFSLTADFGTQELDGTLSNFEAVGPDGQALAISGSVPVDTTIRTENNAVTFDGTMFGNVTVEGELYNFAGLLDGGFAGANAENALGEISGNIGNPDGSEDRMSGIAILNQ